MALEAFEFETFKSHSKAPENQTISTGLISRTVTELKWPSELLFGQAAYSEYCSVSNIRKC